MRRTGRAIGTLAAATSLALVGGGLAYADDVVANTDGDALIAENQDDKRLVFGQVCATTGADGVNGGNGLPVTFYIDRGSNSNTNHTYGNSKAVDFARNATASNAGLTVAFGKATNELVAARLTTPSGWTSLDTTGIMGPLPATVRLASTTVGAVADDTVVLRIDAVGHNNASPAVNITKNADYKVHSTTVVDENFSGGTRDCTKPTVSYTVPSSAGASVAQGATVNVGFTCPDAVSPNGAAATGVAAAACTGIVTRPDDTTTTAAQTGFPLPTATLGTHTLRVTAVDGAGNVGTSSRTYEVVAPYSADYLQPLDKSSATSVVTNSIKLGRVVPVKVNVLIGTAKQNDVALLGKEPTINVIKTSSTGCEATTAPVDEFSDAGQSSAGTSGFRWSADGGHWIYNLDTKALGMVVGSCYRIDVNVAGSKISNLAWAVLKPTK